MSDLRQWRLAPGDPLALQIAADARLSATDYADDQTWELLPGEGSGPALALQTRFGGRVGLVSLVPMWTVDRRTIYQADAYADRPVVTAFAPSFVRLAARITPELLLRAEVLALDSHAIGMRCTLRNASKTAVTVQLDLVGFVASEGQERALAVLPLSAGGAALVLGAIGNLQPAVLLEGGSADPDGVSSSRLTRTVTLAPGKQLSLRIVHVGLPGLANSIAQAGRWLKQSWNPRLEQIRAAAARTPVIETGDAARDAALAFSFQQLMQSFLRPTHSLPHPSFVASRQPGRGFSPRGDGSDHPRPWAGQAPPLAYLTGLAAASIEPTFAHGILQNYLAVQRSDGWIDWKPGLAGQRQGVLCLPILARLAWGIFQYTEDDAFLRDVYPRLRRFLARWLMPDLDADGDGLPEWQSEAQTGYPFTPSFAVNIAWGQHADIRLVEAPDLIAYLLSEALSLREIAYYLHDENGERDYDALAGRLRAALECLWVDGRYAYRDRDTHQTGPSLLILDDARADEEQIIAADLTPPARLIVRITGGMEHVPRMTIRLEGLGVDDQPSSETVRARDFIWTHGRGVYTTRAVFKRIDRIVPEGLVRVYRLHVRTVDTTRRDLSGLLPLWSAGIDEPRCAALVGQLEADFLRPNGVTMAAASDPAFDPANEKGAGGVWPFWLTLIGEGLIECGYQAQAVTLLERLLAAQVAVLRRERAFYEFYHADQPAGLGERGHTGGIVPLHLFLRVIGVRIIGPHKVWTGGPYLWSGPVTLRQHGVVVRRSAEGTEIRFASGRMKHLPATAPFQEVRDAE
jgi:plasmid stabilization system protein ParE